MFFFTKFSEYFVGSDIEIFLQKTDGINEDALKTMLLTDFQQQEYAQVFNQKRNEWLASRKALSNLFGIATPPYFKNALGKPLFSHQPNSLYWFLSMSHTNGFGAAIKSTKSVGIDIQLLTPKLRNIEKRFCSEKELEIIYSSHFPLESLHVYWGAKEAIYKAYGLRGLDALENNFVDAFVFHPEGGATTGRAIKDGISHEYNIGFAQVENCILCWAEAITNH
jgi:4'-phosphopantetheinyl transferase